jgi:hypothetical protein
MPSSDESSVVGRDKLTQPASSIDQIKAPLFRSLYANNTMIAMSTFDFSLIFGEITGSIEGRLQIEQHTKIIMSPLHAKVLAKIFADNVDAYEKQFGEIKVPGQPVVPEQK